MDNDLLARLRPPSESTESTQTTTQSIAGQPPTVPWEVTPPPQLAPTQTQPTSRLEPVHQSGTVPPWDLAPVEPGEPQQSLDTQQPTAALPGWLPAPASEWPPTAAAAEQVAATEEAPSMPWLPESREEVPWDRPDDYDQPTDTAALDEQTTWDKPPDEAWVEPNPEWPPVPNAVSQQAVESADPYDAFAPVLGDVASNLSLALPETNGHHTDLNGSVHTEWADAAPERVAPATAATSESDWAASEPESSAAEAQWVAPVAEPISPEPDPSAPEAEWFTPQTEPVSPQREPEAEQPTFAATEPPAVPTPPATYAEHQMGPTPPDDLFVAAATAAALAEAPAEEGQPEQEVEPEREPEPEPTAKAFNADAWQGESSAWPFEAPADDLPVAPEFPPAPDVPLPPPLTYEVAAAEPLDFAEAEVAEPETIEPEAVVSEAVTPAPQAPAQETAAPPVVLRIELAIVDGQLQVVNSTAPSTSSPAASGQINVTLRNAEFDTRSNDVPAVEPEAVAAVPLAPLAPATEPVPWSDIAEPEPPTIPAATPDVPWAVNPVPDVAPETAAPWAQDQPSMDPLAAIASQNLAPSAAQHMTPQTAVASSIFAPPVQPDTHEPFAPESPEPAPFLGVTQNQNDLWFPSTEPKDLDAVTAEQDVVVPKESSSVLTAVITIGMAILVVVLVLVFFSLMTSLLG